MKGDNEQPLCDDPELLMMLSSKINNLNGIITQLTFDEINVKSHLAGIQSYKKFMISEKKKLVHRTKLVSHKTFNSNCKINVGMFYDDKPRCPVTSPIINQIKNVCEKNTDDTDDTEIVN